MQEKWRLWQTRSCDERAQEAYGFILNRFDGDWDGHCGTIHATLPENIATWICDLLNSNWENCPFKYQKKTHQWIVK